MSHSATARHEYPLLRMPYSFGANMTMARRLLTSVSLRAGASSRSCCKLATLESEIFVCGLSVTLACSWLRTLRDVGYVTAPGDRSRLSSAFASARLHPHRRTKLRARHVALVGGVDSASADQ